MQLVSIGLSSARLRGIGNVSSDDGGWGGGLHHDPGGERDVLGSLLSRERPVIPWPGYMRPHLCDVTSLATSLC